MATPITPTQSSHGGLSAPTLAPPRPGAEDGPSPANLRQSNERLRRSVKSKP
ncbi:hypothetical protein EG328_005227 [Venturia inaequalis]|uniref:Uncharacterized protein n=1 Tax=Venturia inaequalis TaxID=5025 RepID=A0A8H3Z825_VENIN|nr:hypothetical protein EG328_005227 [Venturia inaequalis]